MATPPPSSRTSRSRAPPVTLKRGTLVKNIRLTDDPGEIECDADKIKGLVLKTAFLKRA